MQNFIIIFNLVVPVFLIVMVGYILKRAGIMNENFVKLSSKIVFTVSLPALIFVEVSVIDLSEILDFRLIIFIYAGTIISFVLIWLFAIPTVKEPRDQTVFIQGSFRGNFAIVGLALIMNLYGSAPLGKASIVLAFTIPLYNVLSVIALTVPLHRERSLKISTTLFEIAKNPLIIGVVLAVAVSYFKIPVHPVIKTTGDYLAELSLPLALIGIGGFMSFNDIKKAPKLAFSATVIKLILIPLAASFAAYEFGFTGDDLGIIFILFACPTAIASFIMADAMGSNSRLAANILLITTIGSVVTITIGLFILKENGLL